MVMAMKPGARRALRQSTESLKHHCTESAWHFCQALRMAFLSALAVWVLARKRARRWFDRRSLPPKP